MKEDGFSLDEARVAIIGLGLMGGSLAMALKESCRSLVGLDVDPSIVQAALDGELVDHASTDPSVILPEADLILLAAPVNAILGWLHDLPSYVTHPCIVLDIGSTKRLIAAAMERLPGNFDPIGGHPICGSEKLTLLYARADLYMDAPLILTPLERTTPRALSAAKQVGRAAGAQMVELTPEEHDRILASTSHLPYLLSSALALATPPENAAFSGPGFRSTARLAGTPASMMLGVLGSNRDNILESIGRFRRSLSMLEAALQNEDDSPLAKLLGEARAAYEHLITAQA